MGAKRTSKEQGGGTMSDEAKWIEEFDCGDIIKSYHPHEICPKCNKGKFVQRWEIVKTGAS